MSAEHDPPPDHESDRDAVTARLLASGDPEGLTRLLTHHGGTVRAWLRRDFGRILDDSEIDAAMSVMAVKVWHAARRFDARKGTLRAWTAVIARNCALSLLAERRRRIATPQDDLDRFLAADPRALPLPIERRRLLADLHRCLAELPPLQRAVLRADLAHGGSAPADRLARELHTTTNSIYVSRQKGRRALRAAMAARGHEFDAATPPDRQFALDDPEPRTEQA